MPKIDCFTKHFPTLSTEFSNRVKEGMSDHEQKLVGIELALEEHKKLNDKLNKFKKGIGIKKSEYTEPENFKKIKEINEEYNKNINQLKSKQDAIQESKTGEIGVRNETAIRQEVGSGNSESKEPTNKSNGQSNKESKENGASKEPNGAVEEPKSDNDKTSIKNDITNLRRNQFGLNEAPEVLEKEFGESLKQAKQDIENGYDPENLVEELYKKPRPLTDVENAKLLIYQNGKEIELENINKSINESSEKDDKANIQEFKIRKANILDKLQRLYDVNKSVGTENARGLASRRMMIDRKYSLSNMISEKRASANDGKPLTEEQEKQIEDLHKKIKETQKSYDDYIKKTESEIKELQEKILSKPIKDKKAASQKLRDWADNFEKKHKGESYATIIPITPKMIADAVRLIADGIDKGEDLLKLVKNTVDSFKKDNPDIDEKEFTKQLNKELIDANLVTKTSKEEQEVKKYNGLLKNGKIDNTALKLKADANRAQNEFDISIKQDELKNKSLASKSQDTFIKWERGFKLSNPLTLAKLMSAGGTRLLTTPLEDIVGGAYSLVLPKLAKGAIGEGGGLRISETAKAYKKGLIEGMKDAYMIMKRGSMGKSNLDTVFGKLGELPPEAIDFFGQLHSATKAPFKRAIFERQLEKRLRRNIANGVDVSDPLVQTSVLVDAYKDANRAIFMQDNKVATAYQKMVGYMEKNDLKGAATVSKFFLPFVKVPTNIAAEIGANIYGVPVGATKLIHGVITKGMENIPKEEKEQIFRYLKKGSLGAAAIAIGYFNPTVFGGYYQNKEKRKKGEAKANSVKIFGTNIPAYLIEAPIFQAAQIGATIRRVKDKLIKGQPEGIGEGIWAGASGAIQKIPLVEQPTRISSLFKDKKERDYYLGELAKSSVDPALVDYLAKATDPADEGSILGKAFDPENKRATPETTLEHIKSGLPYFREQLLLKKK